MSMKFIYAKRVDDDGGGCWIVPSKVALADYETGEYISRKIFVGLFGKVAYPTSDLGWKAIGTVVGEEGGEGT